MAKLFLFVLIFVTTSFAQIQKSGNLQSHIDSIITNMPDLEDNNDYQHPTVGNLTTWESIIDDILAGNYSTANTTAQTIGYRVTEFTDEYPDPDKTYYMLQNNPAGTNYWGTYIFNPSPDRAQLVIQSPHPQKDFNTGKQGFYVFREVGARSFHLSGTTRCSSTSYSLCDGTTSICGSDEAYRISDQAHMSDGTFQKTTERLFNYSPSLYFIQLHGFTKEATDPDVIMSNGISTDTPPTDYLSTLKTNLDSEDNTLIFKIAHVDSWTRLIGTTNTQGRLINGSIDPCEDAATDNTGQFLHLEQEKTKLRDDQTGWTKMSNAIAATFPLQSLPVELILFSGTLQEGNTVLLAWETATEVNNYGFNIERYTPLLFPSQEGKEWSDRGVWSKIGFVPGHGTTNSPKSYSFTDTDLPDADKVSYRLKQIDNDGSFEYSKVVTVDLSSITSIDDKVFYQFALEQNYPNPYNPSTTINISLPASGVYTLKVYNSIGLEVAIVLNSRLEGGNHTFNFDASKLASGMYIYTLRGANHNISKKMLLLR